MSGVRRLIVGQVTQGNLRGKALSDSLARELKDEDKFDMQVKKKIDSPKIKNYGKKK